MTERIKLALSIGMAAFPKQGDAVKGDYCFSVVLAEGEWKLLEQGSSLALLISHSRSEIITIGEVLARAFRGRLVVHHPDGAVEAEHSYYGRDDAPGAIELKVVPDSMKN